jgi:SAM-dependent methyltransferase
LTRERASALRNTSSNLDERTVAGFGEEWKTFDQSALSDSELRAVFDQYFHIFPWHLLPEDAEGFDLGCGSGRWARLVAPRVGTLHCIDASSSALDVAQRNLAGNTACQFHLASVEDLPLPNASMDFGYGLGVLHHVPDPAAGIRSCVQKLKPGAPFLIYLYYALDNRQPWFRMLWRASDAIRRLVSRQPHGVKLVFSTLVAALVYVPLARAALVIELLGGDPERVPLAFYRRRSFYTMRTDALDRFGTRLEQRFTQAEIARMLSEGGLTGIRFSDAAPYWCAVGVRQS